MTSPPAPSPAAPLPADESDRLRALNRYAILDTAPDAAFDRLTRLAGRVFDVPVALVSLVDSRRQWFKACLGLDSTGTPRDQAFCAHAILRPGALLEVLDPQTDPRFAANPLVTGAPGIRYYAGMPLVTPDGRALGTFCLIDRRRRDPLSADDRAALETLAAAAVSELELRRERLDRALAAKAAEDLRALTVQRLGHLAHELKTPLTAILGYSQLLGEDIAADPAARERYAAAIERAGGHMATLVDRLLSPLRRDGAQVGGPDLQRLAVAPLLEDVADLVAPLVQRAGMTLDIAPADALPAVEADPLRLRQILINFITNATKYAATGTLRVAGATVADGLRLSVRDEGPGIAPEDQARLFDDGVRLAGSEGRDGFGKGLALARLAAQTMGGRVGVDSAPGAGATFWVELPVA